MGVEFGSKEEHNMTNDHPDECVENQYPTEGDVGQVKNDQGQAIACEVALESELSCDKTGMEGCQYLDPGIW